MLSKILNKVRKNKFTVLITVFVVGLIGITLGSALLNSILTLTGNTKIKENKWLIHFEFVDNIHASHPNSNSELDARITDPTTKKENISFTTKFQDVGDFYEFNVYTWNEGTIDAVIDSLELNVPNEYKDNIELSAYYDDSDIKTTDTVTYDVNKVKNIYDSRYDYSKTEIKPCDPLYKDTMRKIIVRAEYKKEIENLTVDKNITFNVKINYVQEKSCDYNPNTKRLLRIRPNGGVYNKTTTETKVYLNKNNTYTVKTPTRDMYNFEGWEVISPTENGTYTFTNNIFTMGDENVILEAKWTEGDYVARIMNKYYPTIQEAFDDVDSKNWEDNTVWLLKDTTEYPTNRATHAFKFNLDGHTVTGTIQNNAGSNITLVNGLIKTEEKLTEEQKQGKELRLRHEAAFINYGTLTLGINDTIVDIDNSIALEGNEYGLLNFYDDGSKFNFYDGYIEGDIAIEEGYNLTPDRYYVFVDHNNIKDCQRAYLIPSPNRAVAKTTTKGSVYYYNLQDAINSVEKYKDDKNTLTDNDYIITIIRDFEGGYPLNVASQRIFIDFDGKEVETGESITNNGYLKIYNSSDNRSNISASVSIVNNNKLIIDNVSIASTTDDNVIENKGNLTLSKTNIIGKTGYGINNTDTGVITADNNTYVKSNTTYGLNNDSDTLVLGGGNYYGVKNSKTLGINGDAKIYKSDNTEAIKNTGTVNMSGGTISGDDSHSLINNSETFNITGGTINNIGRSINGGEVYVKGGTITSVDDQTINASKVEISAGIINNTNSYCVRAYNADISGGEVNSENSSGIYVEYTLNMTGGKVTAGDIGLYGNLVNISAGEVNSANIGAQAYTYYTYYEVEHPGIVTITGGKVNGSNYGVYTDYIEMSNGTVTSDTNIGISVYKNGNIVGGKIQGELYGVLDNKKLTIGEDDGTISRTNPEIIGGSYGLFIPEGKELNFNDGILKGTIDGYSGIITNTPKGAVTVDDTETIDDVLYNTDYLIVYEPWLEIEGKGTYNTIDDATRAADNGEVIKVIKSVDDSANGLPHITFKQSFVDPTNLDKEVTFDLNGHTVRSTQPITNEIKVTIVDSSENHTGTFKPKYGASIANNRGATLTLNGGNYLSNLNEVIDNSGTMIVESAYFDVDNYGIYNHNELIINDINIARSKIGVRQNENDNLHSGSTTMNGGIINASENGIQTAESWGQSYVVTVTGGKIIAGKNGLSGSYGRKKVTGGEIIATEYGIYSSDGDAYVTGGKITSLTKDGIYSDGGVYVSGGTIIGKEYGIRNGWHALAVGGEWCDITIEGGHIIGQTKDGINNGGTYHSGGGAKLTITGGKIEGKVDGVYTNGKTYIGEDDGSISKVNPEIVGHTKYALETTNYTAFYDGILKAIPNEDEGRLDVYKGLISIIPDGSYIYEDFEINQQNGLEYQTRYLETKGDWLQIGDDESRRFNSLNAAYAAMTDSDTTIKVIATAYINFKQKLPAGKNVILDMNNYSVVFTQPIEIGNNTTVIDSGEDGYFNNIRDDVFTVSDNGSLTINAGTFNSETDNAVTVNAGGQLTINDGTLTSDGRNAITNSGTVTVNKGNLSSNNVVAINNYKNLTVKGGVISSPNSAAIYGGEGSTTIIDDGEVTGKIGIESKGTLTINDGTITSTNKEALKLEGTTTINGGTIIAENDNAVYNQQGTLTVNNKKTTITSLKGYGIGNGGVYYAPAAIIINDGTITGSTNGVVNGNEYSRLTINGGNIEGKNGVGVNATSITNILGGTIVGSTNGVFSNGTTTIGSDDGTINIDSPSIRGDLYGLYIEGEKLYFNDGILKGITERVNDYEKITKIPVGAEIIFSEETIDEKNYLTAYLYQEQDIARNLKSGKECPNALRVDDGICIYNNLQKAFTDASDGETIQILETARAVPIYYEVTNDKDVTLDLNGKTITSTKKITNNGKLIVTDSTNTNGTIRTSANGNLITSSNELTLNNVKLINNSTYNYVVNSSGKVTVNNSTIQAREGIYSTGEVVINNSNFITTNTGIYSKGKLTVNGGTYNSDGYAIYASTTGDVSIDNVTVTGSIYDTGNNTATIQNTVINGSLQNYSNMTVLKGTTQTKIYNGISNDGTLVINEAYIKNGIANGGTATIDKCSIEEGIISNSSSLTVNDSTFTTQRDGSSYYYISSAIYNSGTATFNNTNINVTASRYVIGIDNSGIFNINDNTTMTMTSGSSTYGIRNNGTGKVNISNGTIILSGATNEYGLYSIGENAKVTLINGKIETKDANTTYGAYLKYGTLEMGVSDGGKENADVSTTNPLVISTGTNGIGVKKESGFFNFYDGKIWGSKYSKPETTSNVEYQWEATTYIDEDTGFEFTILEYMPNDYEQEAVAYLRGTVACQSVQWCIDNANEGDTIKLVRSTTEENISIPSSKNIVINLNRYTITGKITNDGTVNIYNGTLSNHNDSALVNNGTFIMGDSTDPISSANIRILSDKTAVVSTGTFNMHDGYIEGNPAINGDINTIPPLSRIRTSKNDQRERKTLQSLDEQSIIDGETDLRITIDPNTGYYDNRNVVQEVYLQHLHTYNLNQHTIRKNGCDFAGWEVSDPDAYNDGVITVNLSDITVKAKWTVNDSAVAQIGTEYYESLSDAIFHAKRGDTVLLLKDTAEDITNDKDITLNLNEHKVTGSFINNGILVIDNGTIENTRRIDDPTVEDADEVGIAIINNKELTMGINNIDQSTTSVKVIGTTVGIKNNGRFNFYDGFVQGDLAISGKVTKMPAGLNLIIERVIVDENTTQQKATIGGTPENAVAETRTGGTQYYFDLADAVSASAITGYEIYIRRDFEEKSDITVSEGSNIVINMQGYTIGTAKTITNNGTLKLYSEKEGVENSTGIINTTGKVINNGTLNTDSVNINQSSNSNVTVENKGTLNLKNTNLNSTSTCALLNDGTFTLDTDSVINSASTYSLNNRNTSDLVLDKGTIYGIETSGNIRVKDGATIDGAGVNSRHGIKAGEGVTITVDGGNISAGSNAAAIYNNVSDVTVIINGGNISASGDSNSNGLYCTAGANYVINGGTISSQGPGIRVTNNNCNLDIKGGTTSSTDSYSVYVYADGAHITMTDGIITNDTNNAAVNIGYGSTVFDMSGGEINAIYGLYTSAIFNMTGGEINVNNTKYGGAYYGVKAYGSANVTISNNSKINALTNSHGIEIQDSNSTVTLKDNAEVNLIRTINNGNTLDAIYIYYGTLNIKDNVKVNASGTSICGIEMYANTTLNIDGGTISSEETGIKTSNNSSIKTININGGKVVSDTYGIITTDDNSIVNIGNKNLELSTTVPTIVGELYGIYKSNGKGKINFYNGIIKGKTDARSGEYSALRKGHNVVSEVEVESEQTYAATDYSSTATANTVKEGSGQARITYIGETQEGCTYGSSHDTYSGEEDVYTVPCTGKYKLEVWGAQGGTKNASYPGGYGGYAAGEITLNKNDKLYINAGGQGTNTSCSNNANCAGGYNGGGTAGSNAASGGGATHIATKSGLLSSLENDKDKILIVAGGGGGSYYSNSTYYGKGGTGGGTTGVRGTTSSSSYVYGTGGTQTKGGKPGNKDRGTNGSFGQGGNGKTYSSGGGGGYYGGGTGNSSGAGGGSGYLCSRLENAKMYTFNGNYTINYLTEKEGFLRVNSRILNNFEEAIEEAGSNGTIYLIKDDIESSEEISIPENTNITFDINGHDFTTTQTIVNNGTLKITDSSGSNKKYTSKANTITNNGELEINDIEIDATGYTVVNSSTKESSTTIDNTTIKCNSSIVSSKKVTLIITDSNITSTNYTVNDTSSVGTSSIDINNSTITSSSYAIRTNAVYNITDSTITASSSVLRVYTHGTINNSNLTSTGNSPTVEIYNYSSLTMTGGSISGYRNAISGGTGLVLTNVLLTNDYNDYVLLYGQYTLNNCTIISEKGGGIANSANDGRTDKTVINGGTITAKNIGIYSYVRHDIEINSGTIKARIGIYNDRYGINIDIKGGEIIASDTGIYLKPPTTFAQTLNILGGSISGEKYGIDIKSTNITVNMGSSTADLSTTTPYVTGGDYAINNASGVFNFYNGRLRGKLFGYNGDYAHLRKGMVINTEYESTTGEVNNVTNSTNNKSEDAISEYAKIGNGHARITYIGESTDTCSNGDITNISYTGQEETYNVPCTGDYKLEVWGAQGGSSANYSGGYGGYSTGKISLTENDTLYINVGGEGTFANNAAGGYNGGGEGYGYEMPVGSGGGATHIATSPGLLSSLESNKESILIVAGGGGGAYDEASSVFGKVAYGNGGSGGGLIGGDSSATVSSRQYQYIATGGTQTEGGTYGRYYDVSFPGLGTVSNGAFGQGGYHSDTGSDRNIPGGGAGWYGGAATVQGSASGGSGYVGNSNLTNGYMVGYHVNSNSYVINYLTRKTGFLEVSGEPYSSFDEALEAIEGDTGTIKVLNSNSINEEVVIPSGKTITLDMNGKTITTVSPITNQGTFNIVDNSTNKGSKIKNTTTNLLVNEKDLSISNVRLETNNIAVYTNVTDTTLNLTSVNISSQGKALEYTSNAKNNTINITNSEISSVGRALNLNYGSNYDSNKTTLNITDSKITSSVDTLYLLKANGTISNSIIETTSTSSENYALSLYTKSNMTISGTTKIKAKYSSGIRNDSTLTIDNIEIESFGNSIYSLSGTTTMNDGSIKSSTVGIYLDDSATFTMNGGSILSKTSGLYLYSNSNMNHRCIANINSGTINSEQYGVYLTSYDKKLSTVNIGNTDSEHSTKIPLIKGVTYAIYKDKGFINFYNGRLEGGTAAHSDTVDEVKSGYDITYSEASLTGGTGLTYSISAVSDTPEEDTPKKGNGYAKITYVGTDTYTFDCNMIVGHEYVFTSKQGAQTFAAKCSGNYKVELWGAQGNNNSRKRAVGGKGAYTTGIINLNSGDNLFLYVGNHREDRDASFNAGSTGGSQGDAGNNGSYSGYGGGGATDVRLVSGEWNNSSSLASRIMVAAGGGGATDYSYPANGGAGGALIGSSGNNGKYPSYGVPNTPPTGGTQIAGGKTSVITANGSVGSAGSFGIGGNGNSDWGSAGGGGYYGGGGGGWTDYSVDSGAGGSSYISGYKGSIAITSSTNLTPRNDSNGTQCTMESAANDVKCSEHYSGKVFTSANMISGNESMPTHAGSSIMTGNEGDGYARITYLGDENSNNIQIFSCSNTSKEFDYIGDEQVFNVECTGTYKLEVWGAQGGSFDDNLHGGYGGYSSGTIELTANEKLYINVGGRGILNHSGNTLGGYNGGGAVYEERTDTYEGSGGGATHIATSSGILSSLENNKESIIIVAGGGGGASYYTGGNYSESGGSGGGYRGADGLLGTYGSNGKGGSQTSGGTSATSYAGATGNGSFGQGGFTTSENILTYGQAGGGGGYYGGGIGAHSGAGGGSGYLSNELTDSVMYGYNVNSSDYQIAYLTTAFDYITNVNTGDTYNEINTAITEASDNDVLQFTSDKLITTDITIDNNKNVIIDLNGKTITTTKSITNKGTLSIINDLPNTEGKLIGTNGSDMIINSGNSAALNIDNVTLEGYNTVTGKGLLTITSSKITGSNYSIYSTGGTGSTGSTNISIDNSTINGNIRLNNSNRVVEFKNTNISGDISNNYNSAILKIIGNTNTNNVFNGTIVTANTTTIKNMNMTGYAGRYSSVMISTTSLLDIENSEITYINTYSSVDSKGAIDGSGTLTSKNNKITVLSSTDDRNGNLYAIGFSGILTSENDTFNISNGRKSYAIIKGSNNNIGTITNPIINISNSSEAYGIDIESGAGVTNITGGTITINTNDSTQSAAIWSNSSTDINVTNISATVSGTTSYGIYMTNTNLNLVSGNISASGTTTYGIYKTTDTGTITLGTFDDVSGESTLVSETIPSISAIGTTTGIGIKTSNATFNYYDGKILGSTSSRVQNEYTNDMEKDYEAREYTDGNGYKYCVPKYIFS